MADASSAATPPTVSALRNVIRILLFCGSVVEPLEWGLPIAFEYVGRNSAYPTRNL